ncbi:peptidylprolyl isomerase [Bradyrhizobium hipponense]|uniref:Peptidylprolyl isomerase n=1 Tax=Bradyrhizobium hipponense TaxID=2605638 RepID=A0A5S4YAR5_9BRAD|nr:peptidylprolyl isomerase [Bradyrhizobium hipponense]
MMPRLGMGWTMLRRCVLVVCLAALGLVLNGCTKCGPIWDDWLNAPKSCRSDRL